MRILVTGGSGFLGRVLIDRLLSQDVQIRSVLRSLSSQPGDSRVEWHTGDLLDAAFCQRLCEGVDEIFHLAALRRSVAYHREHAAEVRSANVSMTENLIAALRAHSAHIPVTFLSSASVPPASADLQPADGYIQGKSQAEQLWQQASEQQKFPLLIVRPVGLYGPGDRFGPDANVIPSLIMRAMNDDRLEVWGDGTQRRSFVYIDDAADALLRLRDAEASGVQAIAPVNTMTVRELAELIRDVVRPQLPIHFDASKPGGSLPPAASLHPALLNFPWMPLRDGIHKTVEWYRSVL